MTYLVYMLCKNTKKLFQDSEMHFFNNYKLL